jgi:hypothetical protein
MTVKSKTIKHLLCLAMLLLCLGIGTGEAVADQLGNAPDPANAVAGSGNPATGAWDLYNANVLSLCWTCPALSAFYEAAVVLGYNFSQNILPYVRSLLAGVFGIWLLWNILKIMTPFGPMGGIGEIFNKIAGKFVLFVFLMAFLSNTGFGLVWTWFITPIYSTGVNLSTTMLQSTIEATSDTSLFAPYIGKNNCTAWKDQDFPKISEQLINVDEASKRNIIQAGSDMTCMAWDVQKTLGVGAAMGITAAFFAAADVKAPYKTIELGKISGLGIDVQLPSIPVPDLGGFINSIVKLLMMFAAGIVLAAVFLIAILLYPLYLIDAMFRLGLVIVLSPILIASYFMELTRSWAHTAIKMLVGVAATLLFQAVVVGLSIAMMSSTIRVGLKSDTETLPYLLQQSGLTSMIGIGEGVMTIWFGFFASGVLALLMMGKASKLAQEFFGMGAGDDVRGTVVKAADQALKFAVTAGTGLAVAATGVAISGPAAFGSGATPPMPGGGGTGPGPAPVMPGGGAGGGGGGVLGGFLPPGGGGGASPQVPPNRQLPPGGGGNANVVADYDPRTGTTSFSPPGGPPSPGAGAGQSAAVSGNATSGNGGASSNTGPVVITGPVTATGSVYAAGGVSGSGAGASGSGTEKGGLASALAAGEKASQAFNSAAYALGVTETPGGGGISGTAGNSTVSGANTLGSGSTITSNVGPEEQAALRRQQQEFMDALAALAKKGTPPKS